MVDILQISADQFQQFSWNYYKMYFENKIRNTNII